MSIEPIYALMGERIRILREMRGETQDQIGQLLGVTRACVSNIEKGRQRIFVHHLSALATHFNVQLRMLAAFDYDGRGKGKKQSTVTKGRN